MKLSRSKLLGGLVATLLLACLLVPAAAFAGLTDPAGGTSKTNPNMPPEPWHDSASDAPVTEWRGGWGTSLYPEFTYTNIPTSDSGLPTLGFLYNVTRYDFRSLPATSAPRWDVTWDPAGATVSHTLDMQGIYNGIPSAERSYVSTSGQIAHNPLEGRWYLNKRWFNESEIGTGFTVTSFGIDLTPPRPVLGFTSGVFVPTETTRRKYVWINQEYDDMSGGAYYELYVNDMTKPVQYIQILPWMPGAATIEDLPPGIDTVGIRVMDRARNEGPMVTHTEIVDPDYPTLDVSPYEGSYVRATTTFSAVANDAARVTKVTFALDGVLKQSSSWARTYSVNTTNLSAGKHKMTVSAYDMFGHVRTVVRTFYVDNVAPTFSSISHSPDPWFPCIQDGYYDIATFKVHIDEFATDVFFEMIDESGKSVLAPNQPHPQNFGPGTLTVTMNGEDPDGKPMYIGQTGSYKTLRWRFTARDRAGNWRIMPYQTIEVRNFQIVDNPNGGGVKVIPR